VKTLSIAAAGLLGVMLFAPASASADSFTVRVGNGHHHHWRHHHGWRAYDRSHCRIVVKHRWHHGRRVTVRKRTCW
jgi:hypothetical protein